MNTLIDIMKQHRSIRSFTGRSVPDHLLREIISAAQFASTSNFVQACTIIQVTDREKREKIAELAGPQPWIEQCPVFLVFCADLQRARGACLKQGVAMASGYTEQFIIATVDAALVAQNTLLAAESLGLGGVYIGGIRNDPQRVCELLAIPDLVYPVFGMCLGYPAETPEQKPRLPLEIILRKNSYGDGEREQEMLEGYDQRCRQYYRLRSSASRQECWTRQVADMMARPLRPHMRAFLEKKGFVLR